MPISNQPPVWLPMTIGSGWVERTWRSEPVRMTRPSGGSMPACKRRPEDVPVWRARLSWGIATDRLDVVRQALKHLPAEDSTPAQVHRLKVWLAAKRA